MTKEDFKDINREHNDPIVISLLIHNFLVKWKLVDQGSSANILYSHATEALRLQKNMYKPNSGMLVRFIGGQVHMDGIETL